MLENPQIDFFLEIKTKLINLPQCISEEKNDAYLTEELHYVDSDFVWSWSYNNFPLGLKFWIQNWATV